MAQADIDEGRREGLSSDERAEQVGLRRENRTQAMEIEILKRASAYFARENVLPEIGFRLVRELAADGFPVAVACRVLGDARDLYDELTDDLRYDPAIGRATMMGYPCVWLAGRFLASYDDKAGCLVVELLRQRVTVLVNNGDGDQFAPAGKSFVSGSRSPCRPGSCGRRCSPRPSTSQARGWSSSAERVRASG